jgi:hypothetical protein
MVRVSVRVRVRVRVYPSLGETMTFPFFLFHSKAEQTRQVNGIIPTGGTEQQTRGIKQHKKDISTVNPVIVGTLGKERHASGSVKTAESD